MKVTLKDGSEYDLGQDLAQHGIEIVGTKGRSWYNFFKNREDQVLRVKDQDGKEHDFDAYAYLANKGAQVDAEATFQKQKSEAQAAADAAERADIDARKRQLEDAGLGEYLRGTVLPYSSQLNESGKMGPARAAVAGNADFFSLIPRGMVGLLDQARAAIEKNPNAPELVPGVKAVASLLGKPQPADVSMSQVADYGADKVVDAQTGKEREETLREHMAAFKEAMRMNPGSVVKDLARESVRDPLTGLALMSSAFGGEVVAGGRVAQVVGNIAKKYKAAGAAAETVKKAADVVRRVDEKIAAAGHAAKLAKDVLGETAGGAAQGVIMNWATGQDKDVWNTAVIEGVEEGAFDLAIAGLGHGAGAAWSLMPKREKVDYLNRVRDYAQENPEVRALPPPDAVPLLPPPAPKQLPAPEGAGAPALPPPPAQLPRPDRIFARGPGYAQTPDVITPPAPRQAPVTPPVMEAPAQIPLPESQQLPRPGAVPPVSVIPNAPGVTFVNGAPVSVDEELPAGVSRRQVVQKHYDPGFKMTSEKDAEKAQQQARARVKADIATMTAAVKKAGLEAEKHVQKAFTEALADVQREEQEKSKAADAHLEKLKKAVDAIVDPTTPTGFAEWDMTLGQAYDSLAEKRKAFEEFHIREAKQAKAIKEKVSPPKAPAEGGPAPKPMKAPDALLEAPQKAKAPRFDADRGEELKRAIQAKLKAQGGKAAAPAAAAPEVQPAPAPSAVSGMKSAAPPAPAGKKGKVAPAAQAKGSPAAAAAPKAEGSKPAAAPKTARQRAGERAPIAPVKVFDETKLDDLLSRLDKKLGNRLNANPGFDPELMTLAIEIGGIYVQKGINSFLDWADKMRATIGERIGPYINSIWEAIVNHPQDRPFDPELVSQLVEYAGIRKDSANEEWSREDLEWALEHTFGAAAVPYVDSIYQALEAFPEGVPDEQQQLFDGSGAPELREEASPKNGVGSEIGQGDAGQSGRRQPRRGSNRRNPAEPADVAGGDGPVTAADDWPQAVKLTGSVSKNIDLTHKAPVEMTPAKRREANEKAVEVLERVWKDPGSLTEADREVLRRYTGLGGIEVSKTSTAESDDHGVRYQHYTSYQVVKNIWRIAEAVGFNTNKRGLIGLEPTAGTGNFIGFAPRQIKWRANEVDEIAGRIMTVLYPGNERNIIGPFEGYVGGKVHLVVSNVPFLKGRGRFAHVEKNSAYASIGSLHNYIIMKSIDQLVDNGIGIFLTSTGTMDAKNSIGFRKELNQKAEVVAAMRLPEGAFKKNANYEGTVDLIILRKRTTGEIADVAPEARIQPEFVNIVEVDVKTEYGGEGKAYRSAWYQAHPDMVMGEWVYGHNRGFTQSGVALETNGAPFEQVLEAKFREVMDNPKVRGAFKPQPGAVDEASQVRYGESAGKAAAATPVNGLEVKGGKVFRKDADGMLYPFRPPAPEKGSYAIPDSAFALLTEIMQLTDSLYGAIADGRDLSFLQDEIKTRLQRWRELGYKKQPKAELDGKVQGLLPGVTKKVGTNELQFRDNALELWVDQDQRYWRLRSLYNSTMTGYSRLLSDQVSLAKPPAVAKGDMSKGKDVAAYVMQKFGVFREEVARKEFTGSDTDFAREMATMPELNFDGEKFVHDNEFLVGNLWPKIDAAEAAGRTKELQKLRKALPEQKTAQNVEAAPQATWWSPDALTAFARTAGLDLGRGQFIGRIEDAEGKIRFRIGTYGQAGKFEDGDSLVGAAFDVGNFVEIVLNQEVATRKEPDPGSDREYRIVSDPNLTIELRKAWREKFENWARTAGAEHAAAAATAFNRGFAGNAVQNYSQEKVFLEGLATTINGKPFTPYPHQFAAVRMARNLFGGLLAWGVGYGKTRGGIFQLAALRADSKVKKALFPVPAKTMYMWRDNLQESMPGLRIKVIRGDQESTRIPDMQDAAVGDYDVIIISHEALPKVPLQTAARYIDEDIKTHRERIRRLESEKAGKKADKDDRARDALIKKINDKVDRLVNKLKQVQEETLDPRIVSFEHWNVDAIWADEAHAYKNYFDVLHEYADKQFLNTGRDSDLGNDFQYKTRYIHERNGRGGVFLLTATPTPNKPIEIYKALKLIAPWELKERGLATMDDFVRNFIEIGYANTTGIDGVGGEVREMVLAYRNLKALRDMVGSYVDIRLLPSEEVKKLRPTEKREHVQVDMSDAQMFGMAKVVNLSSLKNDDLKEIGYDHLTLTSEARMLAVDPARVYPALLREEPDFTKRAPKLGAVMQKVGERYKEFKRLQLVFLDEFKVRDVVPVLDEAGEKIPWPAGLGRYDSAKGETVYARWILSMESPEDRNRLLHIANGTPNMETWPLRKANGALFVPESSKELADFRPIFAEDGQIYVGRREVVEDLHQRMAEHAEKVLGIPRNEIFIVNGEKNSKPQEKRAIEEAVARGEKRLGIGNRKAMGEGMNLQAEGDAVHQVDVPWNPMPLIQAEGRLIRARADESDKHPVSVFYYGSVGSLDAKMYEIVDQKKKWQDDLWLGTADTVSNALDNLEDNGFDPDAMKKSLQVNNAYVAGYQTYSQVQQAKKLNREAIKQRDVLAGDVERAQQRKAHHLQMIENAKERIEKRSRDYIEDLAEWEKKVKTKPELKKPEEPTHGRDQEVIEKNTAAMKDVDELLRRLQERQEQYGKVSWEADLVQVADRMVQAARENKFKSVGMDLSGKLERLKAEGAAAAAAQNQAKQDETKIATSAAESRLSQWVGFVKATLPDIAAKFQHLADMVATKALRGRYEIDHDAAEKVQGYAKQFYSQQGKATVSAATAILGIAGTPFLWSFMGPGPTLTLYGAGAAVFYAWRKFGKAMPVQRLAWSVAARLRETPGFSVLEPHFTRAYHESRLRYSQDQYSIEQALAGLTEDELQQVPEKVENPGLAVSPKVAKAADVWRRVADRIAKHAGSVGYNFPPNPTYYPLVHDWAMMQKMKDDPGLLGANIDHLMKAYGWTAAEAGGYLLNRFDNSEEMQRARAKQMKADLIAAIRRRHPNMSDKGIIDQYLRMKQRYGEMVNGNLKFQRRAPRLLPEMYVRDPRAVLPRYLENTWKNITYRRVFGTDNQLIEDWLDTNWPRFGEDKSKAREEVEEFIDTELYAHRFTSLLSGNQQKALHVSRVVQGYNAWTKLFTSPLAIPRNLLYAANMSAVAGPVASLQAVAKVLGETVKGQPFKLAHVAGAISERVMRDGYGVAQGQHPTSMFGRALKSVGAANWHPFTWTEKTVRAFGFHAGRYRAENLFRAGMKGDKAALKELQDVIGAPRLGADLAAGALSKPAGDMFGLAMAEDIGGSTRPFKLTRWMNTPEGMVLWQFRRMAYAQTVTLKDKIFIPATQGNIGPLIQWGLMVGASSWVIALLAQALAGGQDDKKKKVTDAWKFFEFMNNVNALGLYGDLAGGFDSGNDWSESPLLGTLAGPTVSGPLHVGKDVIDVLKKGEGVGKQIRQTVKREIPLLNRLSKWEIGPFDELLPDEKSGGGRGLGKL